MTSHTKIKKKF